MSTVTKTEIERIEETVALPYYYDDVHFLVLFKEKESVLRERPFIDETTGAVFILRDDGFYMTERHGYAEKLEAVPGTNLYLAGGEYVKSSERWQNAVRVLPDAIIN